MTKQEDGVEIKVERDGTRLWYLHSVLHRDDGPAVEYPNGQKWWFQFGKQHREDGPAIERPDARSSGFVMGSVTETTVQLLSTPMGAKNIISWKRSGMMELRSWHGRKRRDPVIRKDRSAHGPSSWNDCFEPAGRRSRENFYSCRAGHS